MQSIEEFMQSYFSERAELCSVQRMAWDKFIDNFFSIDYLNAQRKSIDEDLMYEKNNPAVVLSIEAHGESATVFTAEPELGEQKYYCYQLIILDEGWQIDRKGSECFFCKGTGRRDESALLMLRSFLLNISSEGTAPQGCSTCKATGWVYDESSHT